LAEKAMSRVFAILILVCFGVTSFDASAAHGKRVKHAGHQKNAHPAKSPVGKHPARAKKAIEHASSAKSADTARNEEWYLDQARKSQGFKAVASVNHDAKFQPKGALVDHLVQQATVTNRQAVVEGNAAESVVRKTSVFPDQNKVTFMFVPPYVGNKLMDLQKRQDAPPMFTLSWKE
jgi:hypothetical protein